MSRDCGKCGGIILEDDLGCQGCKIDRQIKEQRREIDERLLAEKQRERREFVKAYVIAIANGRTSNPSDVGYLRDEDYALYGLKLWETMDKQLTEIEKGERE